MYTDSVYGGVSATCCPLTVFFLRSYMLSVNIAITAKVVKMFSGFLVTLLSSLFLLVRPLLPVLHPQLLIATLMVSTGVVVALLGTLGKLSGNGKGMQLQDHFLFLLILPHSGIKVLIPAGLWKRVSELGS